MHSVRFTRKLATEVAKGQTVMVSHDYWQGSGVVEHIEVRGNGSTAMVLVPSFPGQSLSKVTLLFAPGTSVSVQEVRNNG